MRLITKRLLWCVVAITLYSSSNLLSRCADDSTDNDEYYDKARIDELLSKTFSNSMKKNLILSNPLDYGHFLNLTYFRVVDQNHLGVGLNVPVEKDVYGFGIRGEWRWCPGRPSAQGLYFGMSYSYNRLWSEYKVEDYDPITFEPIEQIETTNAGAITAGYYVGFQLIVLKSWAVGLNAGIELGTVVGEDDDIPGGIAIERYDTKLLSKFRLEIGYLWK